MTDTTLTIAPVVFVAEVKNAMFTATNNATQQALRLAVTTSTRRSKTLRIPLAFGDLLDFVLVSIFLPSV
jgi:Ca2+/H+ antiporter